MVIKNGSYRLIGIILVVASILSSCSAAKTTAAPATLAASPTPLTQGSPSTEVPTVMSAPTATPVPTATATPAPVPTATQAITSAPVTTQATAQTAASTGAAGSQANAQVVPNFNAYCRKGPGPYYDAITYLLTGTAYKVTGRDNSSSWWQIQAPGNVTCWVMGTSVTTQGAAAQVSIVSAPPLPVTPGQFVSSFKCQISVKKFSVALNWMVVNNATGYRIYRNGTVLLELPPASTSYSDNPPLKVNLVYELEAFNDYGVAPRISTNVQACE